MVGLPRRNLFPVLPLRDIVIFPHMVFPLFVGREKSVRALEVVQKDDTQILLVTQRNATQDDPSPADIYSVGTVGTVLQLLELPDGTVKVLVEGGQRARIIKYTDNPDFFQAYAEIAQKDPGEEHELDALGRTVIGQFERYIKLNKKIPPEVLVSINQIDDPSKLADTVASHLSLKIPEAQELLESDTVSARLEKVYAFMESEIDVLQVEKRIRNRVKRQMGKTQREYYLSEQLKAVQKELGEGADGGDELSELEEEIHKTKFSKEAREKAVAELKKLRRMSPMSPETTVVSNYLDWMLSIPWKKRTKIEKDIKNAHKVLEADHYGLDRVKERILEYLAVQQRMGKVKGPILCLVGPPGVGKTSLGRVNRARNRTELRAHEPGRHTRRGRDPRTSADLYWFHARQDHSGHEEGEVVERLVPPGRGRQAGRRLARGSVFGASRGARSRTEQHLQRPLPGGRLRPFGRDVRDHGKHAAYPTAVARPHGDDPSARLHRGRKGGDRQAPPDRQADEGARREGEGVVDLGRCPARPDPLLHARGRRAKPGA
jgi:Lon protease-like protein